MNNNNIFTEEKLFSIVIPCYNTAGKIHKALDSIYSQGISGDMFEVICVDDCSPEPSSVQCMQDYIKEHNLTNMRVIRHSENRRQGGARNTGVCHAKGKYIMFIDQDDYFADGAFLKVKEQLEDCDLDMVMWDHTFHKYGKVTLSQYSSNHDRVVDGMTFFLENEYTWAPWGYSYRREFLLKNDLKIAECVQFEDIDFVTLCISKARSIRYNPFSLIHYTVNVDSQTNIGSETKQKIDFLFQLSERFKKVAEDVNKINEQVGKKLINLSELQYWITVKRSIQYRSWNGRYSLINKYVAGQHKYSSIAYMRFASEYPMLFTTLLNVTSPFLRTIVSIKRHRKSV